MLGYYTIDGEPISAEGWSAAFGNTDARRIGLTKITDSDGRSVTVSTVFLGIDHNYSNDGPPIIFESMTFPEGEWAEEEMDRYSTKAEAVIGHAAMVARQAANMNNPTVTDVEGFLITMNPDSYWTLIAFLLVFGICISLTKEG